MCIISDKIYSFYYTTDIDLLGAYFKPKTIFNPISNKTKGSMGHIVHVKLRNTYVYIITFIRRRNKRPMGHVAHLRKHQ